MTSKRLNPTSIPELQPTFELSELARSTPHAVAGQEGPYVPAVEKQQV
jgi:hypothetical protein